MDPSRYLNHSIQRALQILELFSRHTSPLGVSEISRIVGIHKSTIHRLVITLEHAGWLLRVPGSDKFRLGLKVLALGRIVDRSITSCSAARPVLEELAADTGETVILTMSDDEGAICVDKIETTHRLKISSELGQHFPLHAGATGFAVLMCMPEERVRQILYEKPLRAFTPKTITDPGRVFEKYLERRQKGYIVASGEVDPGVTGIAVPVYFPFECSCGSVGITLPDNRATGETLEILVRKVLDAAEEIRKRVDLTQAPAEGA